MLIRTTLGTYAKSLRVLTPKSAYPPERRHVGGNGRPRVDLPSLRRSSFLKLSALFKIQTKLARDCVIPLAVMHRSRGARFSLCFLAQTKSLIRDQGGVTERFRSLRS